MRCRFEHGSKYRVIWPFRGMVECVNLCTRLGVGMSQGLVDHVSIFPFIWHPIMYFVDGLIRIVSKGEGSMIGRSCWRYHCCVVQGKVVIRASHRIWPNIGVIGTDPPS